MYGYQNIDNLNNKKKIIEVIKYKKKNELNVLIYT